MKLYLQIQTAILLNQRLNEVLWQAEKFEWSPSLSFNGQNLFYKECYPLDIALFVKHFSTELEREELHIRSGI